MTYLRAFISAVAGDWIGRMSGGAGVLLTVFSLYAEPGWQPTAFLVLGGVCLFLACYRVWLFERDSREELLRRLAPLSVYMVEGHVRRRRGDRSRLFVFRVLVSNRSDIPNSLTDVRLVIEYGRGQGPLSNVAVPHSAELTARLTEAGAEPLRLPREVAPRTAVGGLVLFEVSNDLIRDSRVESYTLQVVDTLGHETAVEVILMREVAL